MIYLELNTIFYILNLCMITDLYRQDEELRIRKLGGSVVHWGRWRVEGILAVSR